LLFECSMHPLMKWIILRMPDTRSTHFDPLTHPLHAHAREPSYSTGRKRRTVVTVNSLRKSAFLEDLLKACHDSVGSFRVVTIHAKHEASRIVLNSQRITQRTITKSKLSLEINSPLFIGASARSIRTVWATKIGIASLARFRLNESRLHQYC